MEIRIGSEVYIEGWDSINGTYVVECVVEKLF